MTTKDAENNQNIEPQKSDNKVINFEAAYSELEVLVKRMEMGDQGLEDSLTDFEHGIQLIKQCHQHLQSAEQRIQLLSENQDAEISAQPFTQES